MKINKELFQLVFELHRAQPWLNRRGDELLALMDECGSVEEQQLLVRLLRYFCYLDSEKHSFAVESVAAKIVGDWRLFEGDTQIVAATADSSPDSGQLVVYEIKNAMGNHGWASPFGINRYDKAMGHIKERPNVVLVDEFIGSGRTMAGRIRTLRKQFIGSGITEFRFFVAAYAGMDFSREMIRQEGCDDIFLVNGLRKGISDLSDPADVSAHLGLMGQIEDRLEQRWRGGDLPRLGDAACEALYGRHMGNSPNSVFPVFWWPLLVGGITRKPIFNRR